MKWSYYRYEVDRSPICKDGIVFRPEAKLGVFGNSGHAVIRALIDTGADHSLLPLSLAYEIGATLLDDHRDSARGVGGHGIAMIPGIVDLELLSDEGSCRWSATVGFAEFDSAEDECSIFGHAGCLEYFLASFDGVQRIVELTSIAELPATK